MAFELETALLSFGGVIVGGAITSVTTILLNRAERAKFVRERFWDARREAYTRISTAVFVAERHAARMSFFLNDKEACEAYFMGGFNSDKGTESELFKELSRTIANHRLIMSGAMAKRLDKLLSDLWTIREDLHDIWDEQAQATFDTYAAANRDMLAIGRGELGVPA